MLFVTACDPRYRKAWIHPTLSHLTCDVVCLLHPGDIKTLPAGRNLFRVDYAGDCRYLQDGSFLDCLPMQPPDDEVVVLADVDAVLQRDLRPSEVEPYGGFAIGWNRDERQRADVEYEDLKPFASVAAAGEVLGVNLADVRVFNCGLMAARPPAWRALRAAYREVHAAGYPLVGHHPAHIQILDCIALHREGIPVLPLGYATHSHGHFQHLSGRETITPQHTVVDRTLFYGGQKVAYVHYVRGVTH